MNRDIRFRGKRVDNGSWEYGFYWSDQPFMEMRYYVRINRRESIQVHDKSVGQYTGCKDKNGNEIYEGDIVKRAIQKFDSKFKPITEEQISFIEYRGNGFWVKDEDFGYEGEDMWDWETMEVIGNIYEHKHLLK